MSLRREGLLLVDKPSGPTSHDVVSAARRHLEVRRIGHAGTLDPLASGLLPLAIGRATRLIRFLPDRPKVYLGTLRLGLRTDSDDATGEVLSRHVGTLPAPDRVAETATELTGSIAQIPPTLSAKKLGGRRAYELARAGRAVELAAVTVEVERFVLAPVEASDESEWRFEAAVSPGTYIRALVRDLGERLGCGATMTSLRRTSIGPFRVDAAVRLPGSREGSSTLLDDIVPLDRIPLSPPDVVVDSALASGFIAGRVVRVPPTEPPGPWGHRAARTRDGRLLGIGQLEPDGLHPRVVLASEP